MNLTVKALDRLAETLNASGAMALELTELEGGGIRVELKREPYMTVDEVAQHLKLSPETVRRLAKERRLTVAKTPGKRGAMRFERGALRRDMNQLTIQAVGVI